MKTFEFMYGDTWYKYSDGCIYKQDQVNNFSIKVCSVMSELCEHLDEFDLIQRRLIMSSIISSYCCGKEDKVKEIKRLFNID